MQSQIRSGALSAERALPLLKEICKRIGLESACGAADAVTRLQRLVKELSAERVALDQRLLLARFVEIGQLVRAAKKELITNYDVPPAPIAQLTQVDPGYALSACTSELERLYTDLAEEARTLEQAVAYARLVRAVKKYRVGLFNIFFCRFFLTFIPSLLDTSRVKIFFQRRSQSPSTPRSP